MQVGSIIAYDCDPAKIGEVIKISVCSINHETFLKIKPFGNSEMIYRYKCEVWLLANKL